MRTNFLVDSKMSNSVHDKKKTAYQFSYSTLPEGSLIQMVSFLKHVSRS